MAEAKRRWGMTHDEWQDSTARLRALVTDAAASRSTVTYGEAARVAFCGRFSARSGALMELLGEVDTQEEAATGVMIASLVVRKDTGLPGEGYFAFASDTLGRPVVDRAAFWRGEAEKVWQMYGSAVE